MGSVGRPEEESSGTDGLLPIDGLAVARTIPLLGGTHPDRVNAKVTEERDLLDVTDVRFADFLTSALGEIQDRGIVIDPRAFDHGGLFAHFLLQAQAANTFATLPSFSRNPREEATRELRELDRLADQAGTPTSDVPTSARNYLMWLSTKGGDRTAASAIFERSVALYRNREEPRRVTVGQDSFVMGAAITYAVHRRHIEADQITRLVFPTRRGRR